MWRRLVMVLVGLSLLATGRPAVADACPPGEGTTVVVDFGDLGGGVEVGCARSATTGFEALSEAGFTVTTLSSNPAFVCRIDGLPGPESEDCADTPPGDAFWSYWKAEVGGDWAFSSTGAGGVIQADLEGWSFVSGSTEPPGYAVPAAATTTSATTSTTTSSTTTTTTSTSTTTITSTTTSTTTIPTTTSASSTTNGASTTTPSTTSTPDTAPDTTLAGAGASEGPGPGGFLAGLGGIVAVGAAAWAVNHFRSRQEAA